MSIFAQKILWKTILDMGDLYSDNYLQTFKNLNIFNPLKYIYFLESLIIKNIEKNFLIILIKFYYFQKKKVKKIEKIYHKKIFQIDESVEKINKKTFFQKKNHKYYL